MKNKIIYIAAAVVVAGAGLFFINKYWPNKADVAFSPTPSPDVTLTPSPAVSTAVRSAKPTPTIIVGVVPKYKELAEQYQEEGRRFVLNDSCTEIAPSNVTYVNGMEVMFDNTALKQRRIIKIGDKEYLMDPGEWYMTTLTSSVLPVQLPIYCGSMELGRIDLI